MIIYTGCPGCGKSITLDVRHKEPYIPPNKPATAAIGQCEHCRTTINIDVTITHHRKD